MLESTVISSRVRMEQVKLNLDNTQQHICNNLILDREREKDVLEGKEKADER